MLVFIVIFIIYQLLCDYQNGRGGKPWLSLQRFITSSNFFYLGSLILPLHS